MQARIINRSNIISTLFSDWFTIRVPIMLNNGNNAGIIINTFSWEVSLKTGSDILAFLFTQRATIARTIVIALNDINRDTGDNSLVKPMKGSKKLINTPNSNMKATPRPTQRMIFQSF